MSGSSSDDTEGAESKGLRVLVVEDNAVNMHVALAYLKVLGHEVKTAEDGAVAVEGYTGGAQDVVLMDIQMPRMDGFTATRKIRDEHGDLETPIIAVSAGKAAVNEAAATEAGMNAFVEKPVDWRALDTLMTRLINRDEIS